MTTIEELSTTLQAIKRSVDSNTLALSELTARSARTETRVVQHMTFAGMQTDGRKALVARLPSSTAVGAP